jgi:DNA-directed RNA polymerase beta subunit
MNLGQIYETILGWAGKKLGVRFATPIFDGASKIKLNNTLKAGIPDLVILIYMMVKQEIVSTKKQL